MQIPFYIKNLISTIVVITIIVFFTGYGFIKSFGTFMCGVEINKIETNHSLVDIISYQGSCGATTSLNNKIYLIEKNSSLEIWDEFNEILDTNQKDISFDWRADNTLIIRIHKNSKISKYKNYSYVNGTKITMILNYTEDGIR